ncbi:GNAT family N-acetyltransferase [Arthrobacter sp. L77]|uniref:GNAT family N-acetyltransferase n=1 Tax=Arthrobacter sp. L77 TaxID=1496689 RepID=UPI0012E09699|nr:GNAT family N-acetyltransferase [Arthrobacter sp. L77]
MDFAITPVLKASGVVLELLQPAHSDDLAEAVAVEDLWRIWYTHTSSPEMMNDEMRRRLALQDQGRGAPCAVIDATTGTWQSVPSVVITEMRSGSPRALAAP